MSLTIIFPPKTTTPAPGYSVRTVKKWGGEMVQYSYDTTIRMNIGSFQVIELAIIGRYPGETVDKWFGSWGAVTNFNRLTHSDMMNIARQQVRQFGYNWTDTELISKQTVTLPDGYNLKQKMGWLYQDMTGASVPGLEMWGWGEWYTATEVRYGTMVHGGQNVAVSDELTTLRITLPGDFPNTVKDVPCRKLLAFRRADLARPITDNWLWNRCTVANHPGNGYGDAPKGRIYAPVALDARDFDFAGSFVPSAYYIPEIWLE